ncbi:TPA: DUF4760 domain-containing protein [Proteus mirabilis]|nr:DUF4760 domain-containing protein [Proteus mirabilis]HEK2943453.1 DUF4760 domain-containing protein [Proteus mirabilis]
MEESNWFVSLMSSEVTKTIGLFIGIAVAITSVWTMRVVARKKQTADFLFVSRTDKQLLEGNKCLSELHSAEDKNMRSFGCREKFDTDECKHITYVLNHYERIAIGIQEGIYDDLMLKKASYNSVLRLHSKSKPFIDAVRENEGVKTYYQEFEWLVEKWKNNPLKSKVK